jgi:hypothetical protein
LKKEPPPDAQRYAEEAKTLRTLAEQAKTCDTQQLFLSLAELYETRARLAERLVLHTLTAAALIATHDLGKKNEDR